MQVNVSSMNAYNDWLSNNSNNIANVNTQDYKATNTNITNIKGDVNAVSTKSSSGTDLTKELTDQISITTGFKADLKAVKTQDQMLGSILNLLA
ncbi:MAG: flagellar basal body rod C-terminal domain-containing protein [Sulfurospirillaceae bacterium]|nr:flagellar basal body rod C-terminal domain-containing protein [Sulfurospirillaceae bacterium]